MSAPHPQLTPLTTTTTTGGGSEARRFIYTLLAEIYTPRTEPHIRPWIEQQQIPVLSTHNAMAARTGATWHFGNFPVMADWVFDFLKNDTTDLLFSDGTTRTVRNRTAAILKDAQSGLTTAVIHAVAWWVTWRTGNIIMVTATRDLARDGGKDKLDLLDQYPHLADTKRHDTTTMALRYRASIIWLGGGQSSAPFISNPASLVICDEPVKHSLVNGMIPMLQLEHRLTGDDDGKMISFSTPDDELEYQKNPETQTLQPCVTVETAIHASYLDGTREIVQVPCPHCGHYQTLDWTRLRYHHCRTSLPGLDRPIWDHTRIATETWYQCANPHCTDLNPDGTVRGKIEEHHKREMIHRRRIIATNPEYRHGHRTLQAGGMYNLAFQARTWGAIANAYLHAKKAGSDAAMKGFLTDVVGIPYPRTHTRTDTLQQIRKLRLGYRRHHPHDNTPTRTIPIPHDQIRFVGLTADVQQDCIKWITFAAAWTGTAYLLDWGRVAELEDLHAITDTHEYLATDRRHQNNHTETWPIALVFIDVNYRRPHVTRFLATSNLLIAKNLEKNPHTHPGPRWEGISGRDINNTNEAKIHPHWVKEYPVTDENGTYLTDLFVRIHNINADHWENEWHIERLAKFGTDRFTRPPFHLPIDTPNDFLEEAANGEQYHHKNKTTGTYDLRWRKIRHDYPNDRADNIRAALVMITAINEEEGEAG